MLNLILEQVIAALPHECSGGIPHRAAIMAWYEVAMMEMDFTLGPGESEDVTNEVYGAAIDTYKFFDHVQVDLATNAMRVYGIPEDIIGFWAH